MELVAVIIPTLNEAEAIGAVVAEIPRTIARQVIVADSASCDGTPEAAAQAGALVVAVTQRGYGRACAAGAAAADPECSVLVFLDGDGADRGDLLDKLVRPVLAGTHDFVIASRTRGVREPGSMSWHQVLAGRLAGWGMRALYGVRYNDMCAYRAISRDALARLDMREMTYGWNLEMQMKAARAGLRILEVPMPYRCRSGGESKVAGSLRGTLRAAIRIVTTFVRVATSVGAPSEHCNVLPLPLREGAGGGVKRHGPCPLNPLTRGEEEIARQTYSPQSPQTAPVRPPERACC
jgi:glycosyltransferase involved in cell wall biosynthesis